MIEIYVAHEVVSNKKFNRHAFYHDDLIGCHFDNQYVVSKEVVLLTINKEGQFCYLDTKKTCKLISPEKLQNSITVFGCEFCSKYEYTGSDCEKIASIPSEMMGVVNVMPIREFTNIGDITLSINLVKEYNDSVKGEYEVVSDKTYTDTMIKINSGAPRTRVKK